MLTFTNVVSGTKLFEVVRWPSFRSTVSGMVTAKIPRFPPKSHEVYGNICGTSNFYSCLKLTYTTRSEVQLLRVYRTEHSKTKLNDVRTSQPGEKDLAGRSYEGVFDQSISKVFPVSSTVPSASH